MAHFDGIVTVTFDRKTGARISREVKPAEQPINIDAAVEFFAKRFIEGRRGVESVPAAQDPPEKGTPLHPVRV